VSRGPGTWQRQILRVTSGSVIATVSGIVRTAVVTPDRNDYTAARRGAKQLALAQRVSALYVWCCTLCNEIQDSDDPVACCGIVRPMLAVARPERRRLLLHPAPAPGGRAPSWINVAMPACLQGQLPVPSAADLASFALRRCYERLEAGAAVSVHEVVALAKLARQIEDDAASQGAGNDARWEATLKEVLWLARSHLGDGWPAFAADMRASAGLAAVWGPLRTSELGMARVGEPDLDVGGEPRSDRSPACHEHQPPDACRAE
jgi:hypothetical protein